MNVIKVNYDNAYIKQPRKINPRVLLFKYNVYENNKLNKILRIEIIPFADDEPFYTDFVFDLFLNNIIVARISKNSVNENGRYIVEFRDRTLFSVEDLMLKITGEYFNESGYTQPAYYERKVYTYPRCSEDIVCSEHIHVSDYINGTYIYGFYNEQDGKFYYDKEVHINPLGQETYIYSDPFYPEIVADVLANKIFVDVSNNNQYKWNSENNSYILQLE